MRTARAVAVGIQAMSVVVAAMLPELGITPSVILSLLTISILLRSVKRDVQKIEPDVVEQKVAERTKELETKLVHYEKVATTDALTGLLNRRGIEDAITSHVARSRRLKTAFSFILCDIDFFKRVNDQYGHAMGDAVISGVANVLKDNLRVADFAGRWGGEEYLICLPDTDLAGAVITAEKLRRSVEKLRFEELSVTISLGCAELGGDPFDVTLARADMHLYMAKSKGRNQVFPNSLQKMLDRS